MNKPKLGRIRVCDDSMKGAGINKGDICIVALGKRPVQGKPCAAFTPTCKLLVRTYFKEPTGHIQLRREPAGKKLLVSAPGAVMIFGPVVTVEKGGGR